MMIAKIRTKAGSFLGFDEFCAECNSLYNLKCSDYEMKVDSLRTKVNNYDINKISSVVKQSLTDFIENKC